MHIKVGHNGIKSVRAFQSVPYRQFSVRTPAMASPFAPKTGQTSTLTSTVRQQDGHEQPRFGLGAWDMRGEECYRATLHALQRVGYRHIDTARYYRNEEAVGRAIRESGIARQDIFATTKLFTNDMGGGKKSQAAYQDSLDKSGLDYWDLVLLHAPDGGKEFRLQTWATLSEYVHAGKIHSLGVSNFGIHHIEELLKSPLGQTVKPVVNQIECHPFFAQKELRHFCEGNGIIVQAYCPLARGRYYGNPTLAEVAKRNGRTEAQIMLRWSIQSGLVPLPKSANEKRQAENAESLSFELSAEDMQALDALDRGKAGSIESQSLSQEAP